ncbi:MAG: hypothetical protein V3V20_08365, partial [Algisphaera sp.]
MTLVLSLAPALLASVWNSLLGGLFFRPFFPPLVIAAIAALALAATLWRFRRAAGSFQARLRSLILRSLAVAGLSAILTGPSTTPPANQDVSRSRVDFILDASASMATQDVKGQTPSAASSKQSRYAFAQHTWLNDRILERLRKHHHVGIYRLGNALRAGLPADGQPTERHSHIVGGIRDAINNLPASQPGNPSNATLVVLTDGRDSNTLPASDTGQLATARGVTVHGVTLGGVTYTRDLALSAAPRQPYLMINEPGQLDVWIEQTHAQGRATTLHIHNTTTGETTSHPVSFGNASKQTLEIPIAQSKPGLYAYELSIDPLPGETETANNTQTVFVDVTDQRMRVLLVEGQPFWDTKFIAQTLRRDDRIELTQITQINAERQERIVTRADETDLTPASYEDLCAYDVIILGRHIEHVLPSEAAAALPRYVNQHGGRLVFARGQAADSQTQAGQTLNGLLQIIEPVDYESTSARSATDLTLTPAGLRHPVFAALMSATANAPQPQDLPRLAAHVRPVNPRPATRVLARYASTHEAIGNSGDGDENANNDEPTGDPAITLMPYGRGMVASVLGDGLWRWRLAGAKKPELAGVYEAFWSTLTRWLVFGSDASAGQDLTLRLSSRSIPLDNELTLTLIQRGAAQNHPLALDIQAPDGTLTRAQKLPAVGTAQTDRAQYVFTPTQSG